MKHRFFSSLFTAMVGALAFTSCSNEVVDNTLATGKKHMTFTASYDKNISSRTTLGDDLSVLWASDDVISVLDGTNNNDFTLSTGAGNSTAEFNGTASETSSYYAVYPYQSGATISGNVISGVVIPATQTATLNSFDPKANIMTAVSNSANNLAFKNVCSYAKITTTAACKKITFTAGATDKIAGTFDMIVGADGIASATATSGVNAVTLIPSSGTTFSAGTYYIAVNAGDMSALKVECEYTNKTVYQSINATISIFTRGSIIDLGEASIENGWIPCCYCPDENHPHYVDLGLPSGTKWACMNVGATSPESVGGLFAWGETEPKTEFTWETYKWCEGTQNTLTKYNTDASYGIVDNKNVLDIEDDAAYVNWGSDWRMPTSDEQKELGNNCYFLYTPNYNGSGLSGFIAFKAKSDSDKGVKNYTGNTNDYKLSDKHIFLPATSVVGTIYGGYWTNSCTFSSGERFWFYSSHLESVGWWSKSAPGCIRPVRSE